MNENITDVLAVSVEQKEALDLHIKIKTNLEMAASALIDACQGLKEMKEGNRYTALGFEKFEEYTESALGIKARMAYYYISTYDRLGPETIKQNAALGISKLRLLSEVTPFERESFMEDNDLAGMSVEEIKEAVKERNGLREQLSMFQENSNAEPEDEESLREKIEQEIRPAIWNEVEAQLKKKKSKRLKRQQKRLKMQKLKNGKMK